MAWYGAVAESWPAQAHAQHILVLPAPAPAAPEEGEELTITLDGQPTQLTGRYEDGAAMLPVAAVAQTLGYEVTYTSRPEGRPGHRGERQLPGAAGAGSRPDLWGDQAGRGGGDDRPAGLRRGPLHRGPRHHLGPPPRLFELLGRTVTLEGTQLTIR